MSGPRRFGLGRLVGVSLVGDPGAGRLSWVQALHAVGETLFTVSLAGSLFFSVSLEAARPRIVLFLAVTMAPFLVLAPLIGPLIDRVRGGYRMVLVGSLGGRAVLALFLATQLKGLPFYPLALAILVLAKVFSVSRNSLVPVMVADRAHLVLANSRLARIGTAGAAVAGLVAVSLLAVAGPAWVLRAGALAYVAGAFLALRLAPPRPDRSVSRVVESLELSGPGVRSATVAMASFRAAIGFSLFHLGFVLKRAGEPAWFFGLLGIAIGVGSFLGTFLAPRLRRFVDERSMLDAALAATALMALVTTLRFHRLTAVAFVLVLGLSASVARRAFDGVVQTEAPHARRGRAYAILETRLELGWVGGALAAVVVTMPGWLGAGIVTAGLGAAAIGRLLGRKVAARVGSATGRATLPLRLLETAEALSARGDRLQAAAVAVAAAEAAAGPAVSPGLEALRELSGKAATDPNGQAADDVLRLAHRMVTDAHPGRD